MKVIKEEKNWMQSAKLPMNNSIRCHFWHDGLCFCPERMLFLWLYFVIAALWTHVSCVTLRWIHPSCHHPLLWSLYCPGCWEEERLDPSCLFPSFSSPVFSGCAALVALEELEIEALAAPLFHHCHHPSLRDQRQYDTSDKWHESLFTQSNAVIDESCPNMLQRNIHTSR